MLIEAVVEKGQVRLLQPYKFAHDYFSVKVDIPDEEIVSDIRTGANRVALEQNNASQTSSMLLRQIWATRIAPVIEELDLLDGIEKKYE